MANSLQIYDTLKTAFPEPETRAVTKALELHSSELVTKTDLKIFDADLKAYISQIEVRLIRWMFIFWIGQVGVTIGIILAMVHALKS